MHFFFFTFNVSSYLGTKTHTILRIDFRENISSGSTTYYMAASIRSPLFIYLLSIYNISLLKSFRSPD
jgi:hypothetical protein